MLARCLQHGVPVIAKSTHRERTQENAQILDFAISSEDMATLDALDQTRGTDRALEDTWWSGIRSCFRGPSARASRAAFSLLGWAGQLPAWTGEPHPP